MYEKDIVIYTKGNTAKIFRRSVKLAKARVWITSSWARGWRSKMYPTGGGVTWSSLVLQDSTLIGFLSTCAQQPSNSISRLISSTNIGLCALKVCLSIFIFIYISEMLCWPPMGDYITQQRWLCLHPLPSPPLSPPPSSSASPTRQFPSLPQSCRRSFPSHFHRAHKMTLDHWVLHCLKWVTALVWCQAISEAMELLPKDWSLALRPRSPTWSGLGRNWALPLTTKCMS